MFLISLALTMAASGVIALLTLSSSFSSVIEREEQNAVTLHSYLSAGMSENVIRKRLSEGVPRLSDEQAAAVLQSQAGTARGFRYICVQNASGEQVAGEGQPSFPDELKKRAAESDNCVLVIHETGEDFLLLAASRLTVEGDPYTLLTATDMTSLYDVYREQIRRSLLLSILSALVIALMLLIVCRLMVRPLDRVNRALKQVANGGYGRRLPVSGSEEFRILSGNVNSMTAAIEEKTRLLQETADSRKRFVDSMAHEMKTPLTSILCMGDLLRIKRSVSDGERQDYASVIVEEAKRMKALSSKLLTLASADSSAPDFRESSLAELLSEVQSALQPIMERRSVRLTVAGEDQTIYVDRQLFQTLLINLIDNAAKASSEGQQVLVYHTVQDGNLLLAVVDEGIGMSEQELLHAREAFWMADKSRSRKAGGAGLGLALCEEIAKLHRAVMTITSTPGKGTTVGIVMPLRPPEKEKKSEK